MVALGQSPAEHSKSGKPHIVFLSTQACAVESVKTSVADPKSLNMEAPPVFFPHTLVPGDISCMGAL